MKILLATLMILLAVAGLLATTCGALFITDDFLGLIGIIPGILFLLLARLIWSASFKNDPHENTPPSSPDGD